MKKRLLSAALALAMVLTLLPLSAFAAVRTTGSTPGTDCPAAGQTVAYQRTDDDTTGKRAGTWYWQNPTTKDYYAVTTGFIVGTGDSGAWYDGAIGGTAYPNMPKTGNFKLVGDTSMCMASMSGSVTVDTFGKTLSLADGLDSGSNTVTNLTVTSSLTNASGQPVKGTVSTQNGFVTGKNGFNLTLTNVATGSGAAFTANSLGTVKLNNASISAITMTGTPTATGGTSSGGKVELTNKSSVTTGPITITHVNGTAKNGTGASVSISGESSVTGGINVTQTSGRDVVSVTGSTSNVAGLIKVDQVSGDNVVSVSGGGKATDGITVTQDSGNNTVSVTGSGSYGKNISVTQKTGGSISVTSSATADELALSTTMGTTTGTVPTVTVDTSAQVKNVGAYGDGVKVYVGSNAKVSQTVQVFGRLATTLNGADPATLNAPSVDVNGGTVGGKIKTQTAEALTKDYTVTVRGGGTVVGRITLPRAQVSVDQSTVTGGVDMISGTLTVKDKATLGTVVLGDTIGTTYPGARAVMNVTGFGNTIGAISQAKNNSNKIALTIPGVTQDGKNPKDDDTNRFAGVSVGNWGNWDTVSSSVAGGHFKVGLKGNGLLLLPKYIAYQVEEKNTGKYGEYKYSYWADSEKLMNVMATMTGTIYEIISKGAIDAITGSYANGSKAITLYMYDPRTVGDGYPATNPALPSNTAKPLFGIWFPAPTAGSINSFTMPSVVGSNKSITWYPLVMPIKEDSTDPNAIVPTIDTTGTSITGGHPVTPTADCAYVSNDISYKVTKVLNVQVSSQVNPTVKAKLVNGNIVLSGLAQIYGMGNSAVIPLELETDAIEKVTVNAVWNPQTKALSFSDGNPTLSAQTGGALVIAADDNSYLRLVESNTKIGLRAENLNEYTLTVNIEGNGDGTNNTTKGGMVTTTNRIPDSQVNGKDLKDALAKALTQPFGANGPVDFSLSPTVQQEFGAYIAKLNQTTLNSQLKKVQQDKYKVLHPNVTQTQLNNLTQAQLDEAGYTSGNIDVVLYMNVDISTFNRGASNYTMTATMTPYARVEIHSTRYNEDNEKFAPVVIVNGTSLGTLDSTNVGEIKVTMPDVSSVFAGLTKAANYARQNSTYVAAVDANRTFSLLHTAANGAGFGTIILDDKMPLAEVQQQKADGTWANYSTRKLYDTVQAAVDDARNGEKIVVNDTSSGIVEYPINVTGRARTFYIDVTGNQKITRANNASGVTITQPTGNSTTYTVQLTRDTEVKPAEKPISIVAVSVTGGSASLSASRADEGDTITVTLVPTIGYTVGGITVRTDTGASVSYTATGTNTYRFVVPTGAKSITVTPSFTRGKTGALVTVSSAAGGTATTSAGTNQVAAGSTVSVTTVPSSGYRTMGLSVTSNTGSATATRTGVNSYVFTVPAGATNVVVAPRFDVNNGTVFEDVWSTEYFSSAVAWAVGRGVTNGTDTYHFSPHNNCTRADMVTFLYRAAGSPAVGNVANPFWDVQPGSYYYNAVLWAVSKGITNGVSANQFGVNQLVTRAQAVTFLHRYNGSPAPASGNRFYDVPAREYYANAVAWATGKGVTNGTSTTLFSPNQAVTRAQAVAFLYRDFNNVRA